VTTASPRRGSATGSLPPSAPLAAGPSLHQAQTAGDARNESADTYLTKVSSLFEAADFDGSGTLERSKLERIIAKLWAHDGVFDRSLAQISEEAREALCHDGDGDGCLSFGEFIDMLCVTPVFKLPTLTRVRPELMAKREGAKSAFSMRVQARASAYRKQHAWLLIRRKRTYNAWRLNVALFYRALQEQDAIEEKRLEDRKKLPKFIYKIVHRREIKLLREWWGTGWQPW